MSYNIAGKYSSGQEVNMIIGGSYPNQHGKVVGYESNPEIVRIPVCIIETVAGHYRIVPEIFIEKIEERKS